MASFAAAAEGRSHRPVPRAALRRVAEGIASFPPVLEANPYQRLLYEQLGARGLELAPGARFQLRWLWRARRRVRFLHFHWPEAYYRFRRGPARLHGIGSWAKLALFWLRLRVARALGYSVVWTVHQLFPHETASHSLERRGAHVLARAADLLLTHDAATARTVRDALPFAPRRLEVVPHGSYIGVYPPGRKREEVRAELGIPPDAFVFLLFGDLRGYKQARLLLDAFRDAGLPDARLVVAGSVRDERQAGAVRAAAAADARIVPLLGFVHDDRVAELYGAADAAVLSRGDGGTSGSLILSLSLGVPAVAARTPVYEELLGGETAGWLFTPDDEASLRAALETAASAPIVARMKATAATRRAESLCWTEIGGRTATLMVRAAKR